jgi:hypothetical protein
MVWVCGFESCQQENRQTSVYSFLNKCQRCERTPASFCCPHCGYINYLDGNQDGTHPAKKPPKPLPPPPPPPPPAPNVDHEANAELEHMRRKRALEREIVEEKLKSELGRIKRPPEPKDECALQRDEIMTELDAFMREWTGAEDAVDAWKAKVNKDFKNDPDKMKRRIEILDFWLEKRGMK